MNINMGGQIFREVASNFKCNKSARPAAGKPGPGEAWWTAKSRENESLGLVIPRR